ncbi:MAG: hypothetical protein ACJA13_001333 [Paraglaciecola sp.]|jgi:hypothetical protein
MKFTTLISLLCLICNVSVHAKEHWQTRTWQKLVHYSKSNHVSEIKNKDFFVSPHGKYNPEAEFLATVALLTSPQKSQNERLCRYPARALYLASLGYEVVDIKSLCNDFAQFHGDLTQQQVSIVYADGYLGNPASFYGHLLFKLKSDELSTDLLSNSLNFGAKVPDNENPITYILKGLVGGYDAKYSSNHYYRYNINYTEVEMRDLWQYTLNLNSQEKDLLVAHAWELLFTNYTYYFTHRNCAYHIAKMIELVLQEDLVSSSRPFILPISVFSALEIAKTSAGNKAILAVEHTLSRQARFRQHYADLTPLMRGRLADIVAKAKTVTDIQDRLADLNVEQKMRIFDVLLDYVNFNLELHKENQHLKTLKRHAQQARIKLPAKKVQWSESLAVMPHTGQNPTTLRTTAGYNKVIGSYLDLMLRPAYYDMLSQPGGILPNSALSMAALTVRFSDHQMALSKLDLLNIETVDTRATGLPGDVGIAWKLRLGNKRNYLGPADVSNEFFVESGVGKGVSFDDVALYALAVGRVQTPDSLDTRFMILPTLGILWASDDFKGQCKLVLPIRIASETYKKRLKSSC